MLSEFGKILIFIIGSIVFVSGGLITARIIRPARPNKEKLTSYECGEDPQGNAWGNFNIRFYIIALIFILFEVELIVLFPWATVFADESLIQETNGLWGWFSLIEVGVFVGILVLGLVYAWVKGYLDWIKPEPKTTPYTGVVPNHLYEDVNKRYQKSA